MPTLTHGFEQPLRRTERRPALSKLRRAQFERFALQALAAFSMGSVLTTLIALRTAFYLWRLPT